jgi:outer membrane protein assembly factor BamE (lipoprotein component of BamABCDE complex)
MTRSTPSTLIALSLLAAACAPTYATRGNIADADRIAAIKVGTSTRDDVADMLGTPTAQGTFDANVWYYIGQKTEKIAFLKPDIVERKVVVVQFDDGGVVRDVRQLDRSAGQDVGMVERSTPTAGRELNFIEQMLGNVGRFSGTKKNTGGPGSPTS